MLTLWERLSKENREKIEESKILYPTASLSLIEALQSNVSFSNLKFKHIVWLVQETTGKEVTLSNVQELFKTE